MKFYVNFNMDSSIASQFSYSARVELVKKTTLHLEELRQGKRVIDWGFYNTSNALYTIFTVKTFEELYEAVELVPFRHLCNINIEPVLEANELTAVNGRVFERAAQNYNVLQGSQIRA